MITLFDGDAGTTLLPLTFTRPVATLRVGILTIAQKWEKWLGAGYSYQTQPHLQEKFPEAQDVDSTFISGSVCPDAELAEAVWQLENEEALVAGNFIIAARNYHGPDASLYKKIEYTRPFTQIVYPEDLFKNNDAELRKDFQLITRNRVSARLSSTNTILGDDLFAEEGARAECSTFNTLNGPVYLGKDAEVWEGCHIRGSFALCEHSQVKMGAKIYGMTTIGPYCKAGGEINNSIIMGYSSKGHEGYLGNSVLGEWCNIGADSNNSNMKNNYAEVRLWDYAKQGFRKTGLQFCGLIMADHAKCGINTMFNTGTVVGVSANVFGAGFPRNFVPDFAWGGSQGFEVYTLQKVFDTAAKAYERRGFDFGETDKQILSAVFGFTEKYRRF